MVPENKGTHSENEKCPKDETLYDSQNLLS